MAVFTEETVRANVRNRNGRRVFYLAEGDHLTPSAREWLRDQRIEVLRSDLAKPAYYHTLNGGTVVKKPEHMTHLCADILVEKTHPRIVFRGLMDLLQTEVLLIQQQAWKLDATKEKQALGEILDLFRKIIQCEVLDRPLEVEQLGGFSMDQLREHSHHPQKYYDQPHFMPAFSDDELLLQMNRLRALTRQAELAACEAFLDRNKKLIRQDIVLLLNRVSSFLWILIIQRKKEIPNEQ